VSIAIKVLGAGDEAVLTHVGPEVFDHAVDPLATQEFLADPRHHIAVAIEDGVVVGFASGVHYIHPDKPRPELWVNEIAVASTHRGRGLGKSLLRALFEVGRELGCAEAWVLTERTNPAAMGLYSSSGGIEESPDPVMFNFRLGE
jgi:aminoglycoside 6'-N-acetyltransferase I